MKIFPPNSKNYLTTINSDLRIKYASSAAATMTTTASASAAQRHEHFRRNFFLIRYDEWQCAQSPKSPLLFDDGKWRVFVSSRVVGTGGLSGTVCLKTTWTSWSKESRGAKKVVDIGSVEHWVVCCCVKGQLLLLLANIANGSPGLCGQLGSTKQGLFVTGYDRTMHGTCRIFFNRHYQETINSCEAACRNQLFFCKA